MDNHHIIRKQIIKSHFTNIINTIPKHIIQIHENKKIEASINEISPSKINHVLFEFQTPVLEFNRPIEQDNVVEYIVDDFVDIGEIYNVEDDNKNYNPMYFSLRHYISEKN